MRHFSYFHQSTRTGIEAYQAGPPRKVQTSVVRTNCERRPPSLTGMARVADL